MSSKGPKRESMSYLNNALAKISQEEIRNPLKKRLTMLQKNRIALNYLRFREVAEETQSQKEVEK